MLFFLQYGLLYHRFDLRYILVLEFLLQELDEVFVLVFLLEVLFLLVVLVWLGLFLLLYCFF